jgi:isopentenyl-diphosphate delta-isomerase
LYANLGLAQAEGLLRKKETERISDLVQLLRADGLIIHINPLQEWLQPDGDRFQHPPIDTIRQLMDATGVPLIVKEVGQGMGPRSLAALFALPLAAVELAAHGGTNFATLELLRDDDPMRREHLGTMARVGHSAEEMISFVNNISDELRGKMQCKSVIISGGVRSFLDGFYLMKKLTLPSIYGQASGFLKYAQQDYPALRAFAHLQTTGLRLAYAYLRVK